MWPADDLKFCHVLNILFMTAAPLHYIYSSNFISYFVCICSFTNQMCNKSTDGNNCINHAPKDTLSILYISYSISVRSILRRSQD